MDNKAQELFDQTLKFTDTLVKQYHLKTGEAFDRAWNVVSKADDSAEKELDRSAQKDQAKTAQAAMAKGAKNGTDS